VSTSLFLSTILPALITVRTNLATLRFQTPGPGSYQVAESPDLLRWTIRASGFVKVASHVTAPLPGLTNHLFYVVSFEKGVGGGEK
jgi:uncharacterized protein (DUF2236 family)